MLSFRTVQVVGSGPTPARRVAETAATADVGFDGPAAARNNLCMTPVRQESPTVAAGNAGKRSKGTTKARRTGTGAGSENKKRDKVRSARGTGRGTPSGTKVAQVRLQPDEVAALETVVRRLNLGSTSQALREGLRLLVREAAETQAADEIRAFYQDEQAPLPAGVVPATEAELKAADETQW